MNIRPFAADDEPAVLAIWDELLADASPHNNAEQAMRRLKEFGSRLFFVAECDRQVVATVVGGYDGHRGWLYSLAVLPGYQGRGVARALVRHLEDALQSMDCPKLNLQVRSSNDRVIGFYQSLGYEIEDRISFGKRLY